VSLGDQRLVLRREAVNFPAVESDLRSLSADEVTGMGARAATSGRAVREWQAGIALWPALLWAALALLICEGAVAAWAAGGGGIVRKAETPSAKAEAGFREEP
jgi:hypothetical protein